MVDGEPDDDTYKARLRVVLSIAPDEEPPKEKLHQVAKAAGITYQAAVKAVTWEGKTKSLSAKANSLVAAHYKVDPDWLATGGGKMHSERLWPLGASIPPEAFFRLDPAEVQPALDVLSAAIARKLSGELVGKPANDDKLAA